MTEPSVSSSQSSVDGATHDVLPPSHRDSGLLSAAFGSVGVVFGDIGTSPLYALRESLAHSTKGGMADSAVIGTVSLLLWALFFTVTAKYVLFLMRADNNGEGGTLSLMALAKRSLARRSAVVFALGVAGAALFCGDAVITPAISVLSALEGLDLITPTFSPYVVPTTIAILVALFAVQSNGTTKVANFFGPVMIAFFLAIAVLGLRHVFDAPRIVAAFNPVLGLRFLFANGWLGFAVLGSVFLSVTGAEALYGDMGHFGRLPIQVAWTCFVLPALVLNYLGQGALVLANPASAANPFFLLAPSWALLPLVLLSAAATVIASQAVITGAFSLVNQAVQLGLLPRMDILHTSDRQEGQIYVPKVNKALLFGVILLVLLFRNSSNLASAYGIAVTGTMVVTTSLAFVVAWKMWRWPVVLAGGVVACFLAVDVAFLAANCLKIADGGWVPLMLAGLMVVMMWTWVRGSALLAERVKRDAMPIAQLLPFLQSKRLNRIPGVAVFLTGDVDVTPSALLHNIKHNHVLHERVVLMTVRTRNTPRVAMEKRYEIVDISPEFTQITAYYGFTERPRIPSVIPYLRRSGRKCDLMHTSFFLGRRTLKLSRTSGMPAWQDKLFISLFRQAGDATVYFSLPTDRVVELGVQVSV